MGRKSTKENKNIYQQCREAAGLTREAASEALDYVSADRIEKIESEKSLPHPDEVMAMAAAYKAPALCNYYCSHECEIGQTYVPEVKAKELSVITLEMLSTLNTLVKEKDRLVEIAVDGVISPDEVPDFLKIQQELEDMALAVDSLRLWVDNTIASGKMDPDLLKK